MASRACSSRRPKFTPDGQAVSHARQPRQRSMDSFTSSLGSITPSTTPFIRAIRPLGECTSSLPVSTYVGQLGKQNPQRVQFLIHRSLFFLYMQLEFALFQLVSINSPPLLLLIATFSLDS